MELNEQKKHGFAAMDPDQQRAISSRGGKNAHAKGTAHKFTAESAKEAGTKGGIAISADAAHMSKIGKKGGAKVAENVEHMRAIGQRGGSKTAADREHMAKIGRMGVEARRRRAAEALNANG